MSSEGPTNVLEILQFILEAPTDSLRPHKNKVVAAVQKLQSSIDDQSTASSTALCCDASGLTTDDLYRSSASISQQNFQNFSEPAEAVSSCLAGHNVLKPHPDQLSSHAHESPQQFHLNISPVPLPPSSVENIVTRLTNSLKKIENFSSQAPQEAVKNEPSWITDDPRITDIEIAGSTKKPANYKFRRGLSQRSLALEYDHWERSISGRSRICERAENPSIKPGRKPENVQSFLKAHTDRFKNLTAAEEGIKHGLKLLVCEKILGGSGFSAILIFQFDNLRSTKYSELNDLRAAIEHNDSKVAIENNNLKADNVKKKSIKKLAEEKADWFDDCQEKYDGWYSGFSNPRSIPQKIGSKRRSQDSSNQQKRLKPRELCSTSSLPDNSTERVHGSMLSEQLRVDGQTKASQRDTGENRTIVRRSWTPGCNQPSPSQIQQQAVPGELQSLAAYHPSSQAPAPYNLATLARFGHTLPGNGELVSDQPLLQSSAHYNLASLARFGPSLAGNGDLASNEPLIQSLNPYNLVSLARYGPSQPDGNQTSTEPSLHLNANYNFANNTNCGYFSQETPTNLVNDLIPTPN